MTTRPIGLASDKLIATLPRGERAQLQIRHCRQHTGAEYIDIRQWERTWGAKQYKPGKGVTLRLEELADVAAALETAKGK
jgi:hypothetical protein